MLQAAVRWLRDVGSPLAVGRSSDTCRQQFLDGGGDGWIWGHTDGTAPIQQDEVVEHDLDAGMALARRGILPAQGMEPASNVDAAAFTHVLGADLGQCA